MVLGSGPEAFLPNIMRTYDRIKDMDRGGFKVCLSEISSEQIRILQEYANALYTDSDMPEIRVLNTNDLIEQNGEIFSPDNNLEIVVVEGDMKVTLDTFIKNSKSFNGIICPESVFHTGPRDTISKAHRSDRNPPLLSLISPIVDPEYGMNFSVYEFLLKGGLLGNFAGNAVSRSPHLQNLLSKGLSAIGNALGKKGEALSDIAYNVKGIGDQNLTFMMPKRYVSSIKRYLDDGKFSIGKSKLQMLNEDLTFTSKFVKEYAETLAVILEAGITEEMLDAA